VDRSPLRGQASRRQVLEYRSDAEYYPNNFQTSTIWSHMPGQTFSFGPFLLNLDNGTLLRKGEHVAVGRRGIRLLAALIEQHGEVSRLDATNSLTGT
jgi:DNA-binding response OmpR family regulator